MATAGSRDQTFQLSRTGNQSGSVGGKRKSGVSKKIAQKFTSHSHSARMGVISLVQSRSFTKSSSLEREEDKVRLCRHLSTTALADIPRSPENDLTKSRNSKSETATPVNSLLDISCPPSPSTTRHLSSFDYTRSSSSAVLPPIHSAAVPRISSLDARKRMRNYLLLKGGKSAPVLQDRDDLERCFPDGKVTIFVGSWNMAGQDVPSTVLTDWLIPENVHTTADIYAIGIQEASYNPNGFKEWESKLQRCLWPCKQVLFHSYSLGVQHLAIFIRRELIWFMSRVSHSAKSTRVVSKVKTKGAISIGFKLFGSTFLFLSSHLNYGPDPNGRVRDYHQIVQSLRWNAFGWRGNEVLDNADFAFWAGDLNFRLDETRTTVVALLEAGCETCQVDYTVLMERDQLRREIAAGRLFHKFHEPIITFPPTYKYDLGTNVFDTSAKNRVPAYTDRILYRTKSSDSDSDTIQLITYDSVPSIKQSDHKPVYAMFRVKLKDGNDHMLTPKFNAAILQAGLAHHREEALTGGAFRSGTKTNRVTTTNSKACRLM